MKEPGKELSCLDFDFTVSRRNLLKAAMVTGLLGPLSGTVLGEGLKPAEASPAGWTGGKTTLTYYGQSTFTLAHGDVRLLFDPWFTGSPWNAGTADEINCQYILVSHAHPDHISEEIDNEPGRMPAHH